MSVHRFRVPHRIFLAPTKIQGGKTNEQEAKSYFSPSGCGKGSDPGRAEPPHPVRARAETADAAIAAFRKLRREIMFRFFIVFYSFPGAGGRKKDPLPLRDGS